MEYTHIYSNMVRGIKNILDLIRLIETGLTVFICSHAIISRFLGTTDLDSWCPTIVPTITLEPAELVAFRVNAEMSNSKI